MNKLTFITISSTLLFSCSESMPELPELPDIPNISESIELPDMPDFSSITDKLPSMSDIIPDVSVPTLYEDDVFQGSVLDRYSVNQLRIGMTKSQVSELIGSPSIIDLFHNNQWDYINFSTLHNKEDIRYRLTLKFDGELLTEIDKSGLGQLSPMSEEEIDKSEEIAKEDLARIAKIAEEKIIAEEKAKAEALAESKRKDEIRLANEAKIAEEKIIAEEKLKAEVLAEAKRKDEIRLAANEGSDLIRYQIKAGDSLSRIAYLNRTTVELIKAVNGLNSDFIMAGNFLLIPSNHKQYEVERIANEKAEAERVAKEKAEAERIANEKAEAARVAKEKAEAAELKAQEEIDKRIAEEKNKPWYQFW
ncbi:MAG: outer membrane protein assembly factor BamE [PS1 clade bacterium]